MKMTHVRNATMLLEVGEQRILIDPMLSAKGAMEGFANADNPQRNPLVELTVPLADLLTVDAVAVSHTYVDHWDAAAISLLPRQVILLAQNEQDAVSFTEAGFEDVRVLDEIVTIGRTTITRTDGQHGSDAVMVNWAQVLGPVSGFVVRHPDEPTVYIAGDTVFNDSVRTALSEHQPDIIVLNTGEARVEEGPILMGATDVPDVHAAAPNARIVTVHMEALNHCPITRAQVRDLVAGHGIAEYVLIPEDGETLTF